MGNRCCAPCQNPTNESIKYLQSRSENEWVRKLDLENSHKIIVSAAGLMQPEKSYHVIHNPTEYSKGVIFNSNTFYEGDVDLNHQASGKGLQRFVVAQGESVRQCYYEGGFENNARSGKGKYVNNFIQFHGQWKNGYPTKGTYQLLTGPSTSKTKALEFKIQQISFNNSQMSTGTVTITLPDRSKYTGQFVKLLNDKYTLDGRGILLFPNEDKYDGIFKEGKFEGEGKYIRADRTKKFEGEYKAGLRHGKGKMYFQQNKYIEGEWVKGKKQGKFKVVEIQADSNEKTIDNLVFKNDQMQKK